MRFKAIRFLCARFFPLAFCRWVNRERCYLRIENDPSGLWSVQIGSDIFIEDRSLNVAIFSAWYAAERLPDWQWTSDYLKSL